MNCPRSRFLPIVPAVAAALLLPATPALAGPQEGKPLQIRVDETFEDSEICGIAVSEQIRIRQTVRERNGKTTITGSTRITFTASNGKSVTLSTAGLTSFTETFNADGTLTFTQTYKGVPEKIVGDSGRPLVMDRGVIMIVVTVDFGDPEDPDDDLIEESIITRGPHPEAESGFTLFCEAVTEALT